MIDQDPEDGDSSPTVQRGNVTGHAPLDTAISRLRCGRRAGRNRWPLHRLPRQRRVDFLQGTQRVDWVETFGHPARPIRPRFFRLSGFRTQSPTAAVRAFKLPFSTINPASPTTSGPSRLGKQSRATTRHRLADAVAKCLVLTGADENIDRVVERFNVVHVAQPNKPATQARVVNVTLYLVAIRFVARDSVAGEDADDSVRFPGRAEPPGR